MRYAPETCPNCGADIPRNARACPECGADERTGWSDRAGAQHLDLPDDEFNYDEFVREEFGAAGEGRGAERLKPRGIRWLWWLAAIAAILAFILMAAGVLGRP